MSGFNHCIFFYSIVRERFGPIVLCSLVTPTSQCGFRLHTWRVVKEGQNLLLHLFLVLNEPPTPFIDLFIDRCVRRHSALFYDGRKTNQKNVSHRHI